MRSHRTARFRSTAVAVVALAALSACGHEDAASTASTPTSQTESVSTVSGASVAPTDSVTDESTTSTVATTDGPGTFGTLTDVCGPGSGANVDSDVRGVTTDSIQIGVQNDTTSTIVPGLGQQYLDIAHAFADWCNAAGGINGRKIEIVSRDGKITDGPAAVIAACQSDFMLVGGGTPFDAPTVDPRVQCDLGSIPSYVASPEANLAPLQALVNHLPPGEANVGLFRLLQDTYGEAFQKTGFIAVDISSLLDPYQRLSDGLDKSGFGTTVSFQKIPLSVDNLRNYIQPLIGTADAFVAPPSNLTDTFQAMVDTGYKPAFVTAPNAYGPMAIDAFKATGLDTPYYMSVNFLPIELADQSPTVQKAIELTQGVNPETQVDQLSWAAWMLFAQSATACGADLTVQCVIDNAMSETAYTAGGLIAPTDISQPAALPACIMILSASADGFVYERELTQPTDGLYNCDPANLVQLD